jgi:hypothetical protein
VHTALSIPEIISGILEHLLPVVASGEDDDHAAPFCVSRHEYCSAVAAAAAGASRASLRAAALVNRTWAAAALPLLWRHPTEHALGAAAVPEPCRRAWYAAQIRVVDVSGYGALWRALAGADAAAIVGRVGGGDGGSGHDVDGGTLRLPKLKDLHMVLPFKSVDASRAGLVQIRHHQAPLLRFIGARLETLSCCLTDEVVDCLENMIEPPLPPVGTVSPRIAGQKSRSQVRLRTLHLYKAIDTSGEVHLATTHRFLAWLTQEPHRTAPALTSLLFRSAYDVWTGELVDRAFCHLAFRSGLQRLCLGNENSAARVALSRTAVERVALAAKEGALSGISSADSSVLHEGQQRRRPFEHLTELIIAVQSDAIAPLMQIIPCVMRLALLVPFVADDRDYGYLVPLKALPQLRALSVELYDEPFTPRNLPALQGLTQLRELELFAGMTACIGSAELAALLGSLPHLHTLALRIRHPTWRDDTLRVVGVMAPQLRHLHWSCKDTLGPALDDAQSDSLLFPSLESLRVDSLK